MWKVKSACLYSIASFGPRCSGLALSHLIKLFKKEPSINKQSIAETMIKLGSEGEEILLNIMKTENDTDFRLKSSILRAFGLVDLSSQNIDFIMEALFESSR